MSAVPTGKALAQPGPARVRQVLVVNPNTNPAVTQRVRAAAAGLETARVQVEVANPVRGPFSIETAAERADAEREAVAYIAQRAAGGFDAYVLACFDDLALEGARAIVDAPVIGTCEAGIAAARAVSARLAIVTTFDAAVPGIRALMQRYGAGPHATVRAAGIGVAAAAGGTQDTLERILQCARDAVLRDRAEVVLLASGGLTGLAPALAEAIRRPVVDGVAAAIALAVAQVGALDR
jgi:allantoin racemase